MARNFAHSADARVACSLGAIGQFGAGAGGGTTVAAILKKATDVTSGYSTIFSVGTADPNNWAFYSTFGANTKSIGIWNGIDDSVWGLNTGEGLLVSDGWAFIAASKATSASRVAVRFHRYVYNTGVWTHANANDAQTTINNGSGAGTTVYLGSHIGGGSTSFDGDIEVIGVIPANLTDQQIEAMAFSLVPWFQYQPQGLWMLDQSATAQKVRDITGQGANESTLTATSVGTSSVPVFNYGHSIHVPRRAPTVAAGVRRPRQISVGQAVMRAGVR